MVTLVSSLVFGFLGKDISLLFFAHGVCVHKSIQLILLQIELWNEHDPLLGP